MFDPVYHSHVTNKNSCYIILLSSAHLLVDFCLIFIFNASQMIPWSVEGIFMRTIYLCLTYLGPDLRYISNCGLRLGDRYFYCFRLVHIWWPIQRFIFESSLWEILNSIILYFVDLSEDLHRISCSHILTASRFITIYIYIYIHTHTHTHTNTN